MAMNPTDLASEIASALGYPGNVTIQVQGFAQGIIEEITQNGVASTGAVPSPHNISGITGASMAAKVANYAGYGYVTPTLLGYCTGIVSHITSSAVVSYTGPGGLPPLFFLGGTISGLSGAAMAIQVALSAGYPGVTPQLLAKCTAIADHIMNNGEANNGSIT